MLCLCTNTSCKWKKLDLGQFAEIFQRGEDNFSSKYLVHLQKAKEYKKRKVMLYYPFINFFEAVYGIL